MPEPAAEIGYSCVDVVGAWDESPHLCAVRVELGALAAEYRLPGQALRVRNHEGEAPFAIATRPGEPTVEILVRRGAAVADALIAEARAGGQLLVSAPEGPGFPLDEMRGRDVLLFAAGSGISSIRALVRHIAHVRREVGRVVLYYGQRQASDFAYLGERAAWEGAGVRTVLCCTQPAHDWAGGHGRVQDVALAERFGGVALDGAVAYLCGMKEMIDGVRVALARYGHPLERSHLNY